MKNEIKILAEKWRVDAVRGSDEANKRQTTVVTKGDGDKIYVSLAPMECKWF